MVDNFERIKNLLKFDEPGDCYYLQLVRRAADDPGDETSKYYHGNMHSRTIKDYFISSIKHLEDQKEEIITLCNTFNARAYIRLNKRNYRNIQMQMLKQIAEQVASGGTYGSPMSLIASAAGHTSTAGKDKTWLIDLDEQYLPYEESIISLVNECQSNMTKEGRPNLVDIIPTKSGKHLITHPFNVQQFHEKWVGTVPLPFIDIHKDNPTILYVK